MRANRFAVAGAVMDSMGSDAFAGSGGDAERVTGADVAPAIAHWTPRSGSPPAGRCRS